MLSNKLRYDFFVGENTNKGRKRRKPSRFFCFIPLNLEGLFDLKAHVGVLTDMKE